jgi:zinc protease
MKKYAFVSMISMLFLLACTPKNVPTSTQKPVNTTSIPKETASTKDAFRRMAPSAGPAPKIQIPRAETFTLANGLKVIVVPNSKLPRVSFQIFVDAPPIKEAEAAGYIQMMGDLLSKGTTKMTKAEIDENIDYIGATFGTSSSGLTGGCLTKHSDALLTIMSDVLINPAFSEAELKKAKLRQQSNLASAKDDANTISGNVSSVLNFGKDHPYGEVMTEASLEKITIEQIKTHYSTYFKPNISYLVIVGDIKKVQAEVLAKKYFSDWKTGVVAPSSVPAAQTYKQTAVSFVHKPGAVQSVINITYPLALKPGAPDAIPVSVTNTLLGGYFNSRLNQNLREGKAFTYGARSSIAPDPICASFSANASVRNEVTDSSVFEFMKELGRMRTDPIPSEELEVVKSVLTGNFASSLERPETIARFALNVARFRLPVDYYETYLQNLAAVTPQMVQQMAMKYIQPDKANIVVVGDKGVAETLTKYATSKKVDFYDMNGNTVIMNQVSVPEGMNGLKVIDAYLTAIGGEKAILSINDLTREGALKGAMPMELSTILQQKSGNKFNFEIKMGPNTLMRQVTNGKVAFSDGMEGAKKLEGKELADIKREALMFAELEYKKDIYTLLIKGIEQIDGANAYAVEITDISGWRGTNYYDMASGLKLRETRTQEREGEKSTTTTDFKDYKPVNGVQIAHKNILGGVFPSPATLDFSKVSANVGISDSVFETK